MVNKERVKYQLSPTKRPAGKSYISGYAKVSDFKGGGYAHISFSKCFVDMVAKTMPQGLHDDKMAYIQLIQISAHQWIVLASYLDGTHSEILWVAQEMPTWLIVRRDKHGTTKDTGDLHKRAGA